MSGEARPVQCRRWTHTSAGAPVSWTSPPQGLDVGQTQEGARTNCRAACRPGRAWGPQRRPCPGRSPTGRHGQMPLPPRGSKSSQNSVWISNPVKGQTQTTARPGWKPAPPSRPGRPALGSEHNARGSACRPVQAAPCLPAHPSSSPASQAFSFGGVLIWEPRTCRRVAGTYLSVALGAVLRARVFYELA